MAEKLSLVARLGRGVKAFGAGFGAGISTFQPYEGAGFSRKRPVIYGAHARDSRLDLNEATRLELLKLARHMYRNVGLIKGAVDSIATYSMGPDCVRSTAVRIKSLGGCARNTGATWWCLTQK
jgi:hypothetical protein